ncbi:14 kDa zinc-binding protein-like isoform X2 [Olea europaea var. sylvestris]|uniref:14 kDa zinc-binding protein-like isoform X2 n=1 Tax=Olea europaea var. sylvestris TaxID=158386 RepID=UPI000C1D2CA9|nr:14 kDa zinc-binding protein-like isoform X2 [Olea europaea var. sylvestris]
MNSLSILRGPSIARALGLIKASNSIPHNTAFSFSPRPLECRRYQASATCKLWKKDCNRALSSVKATNDEEAAARVTAVDADTGAPTIFDKIIAKEIPSSIVYEDDKVLAFRDISPQAPVHVLIIPKFRDGLTQLGKAEQRHGEVLGHLLYAAKLVAEKEGIVDGFRVVINSGPSACQSVYHLHLHVLGGRQMKWPPG